MKKIMTLVCFVIGCTSVKAQTFAEWFRQDDTQIKYLLEQIAALQSYGKLIAKGYSVVDDGLTLIGDIKNGEFSLHKNYFSSLSSIAPVIRNDFRVAQIAGWHEAIKKKTANALSALSLTRLFSQDETTYLRSILLRLQQEAGFVKKETADLLTENKYVLTDDARLRRLKELHAAMEDHYVSSQTITGTINSLGLQRARETKNYLLLEQLYELN